MLTPTMKPEVRDLWTAELRKDGLKQGRGYLNTEAGECCLGVLCRLAVENGLDITVNNIPAFNNSLSEEDPDPIPAHVEYDSKSGILPYSVMHWAGLVSNNPVVMDEDEGHGTLAAFNDGGKNFVEIADLIEKSL